MHRALLVLVAACRMNFDEIPDAGTGLESTSGQAMPGENAFFTCPPGTDCYVDCRAAESCVVNCNGAARCTVACSESKCVVTSCTPLLCSLDCGDGEMLRQGATATCS